ncbi:hypothetical protein V8D89_012969 [Ganoderma adspersum]
MPVRTPEKKAVLVGIRGKPSEDFTDVSGAHKDVKKLWELLINTYQYKIGDIKLLMDPRKKPRDPNSPNLVILPTTENIVAKLEAMRDLVANKQAGDHIVFAFSGHGSQTNAIADKNEVDNMDEYLVPLDYGGSEHPHLVLDDSANRISERSLLTSYKKAFTALLWYNLEYLLEVQPVRSPVTVEVNGKPSGVGEAKGSLPKPRARGFTVDESLNHEHAANVMEKGSGMAVVSQAATSLISRKEVELVQIL